MYDNYQIVKRMLSGDYILVKGKEDKMLLNGSNIIDLNIFDKAMQAFIDCCQDKANKYFVIGDGRVLWLAPDVIGSDKLTNFEHEILNGNNFRYYAKALSKRRYGFWYDKQEQNIMFGLLKNKRYHRPFEQQVLSMIADFCREHKNLSVLGTLDNNLTLKKQFICGTKEQIERIKKALNK